MRAEILFCLFVCFILADLFQKKNEMSVLQFKSSLLSAFWPEWSLWHALIGSGSIMTFSRLHICSLMQSAGANH